MHQRVQAEDDGRLNARCVDQLIGEEVGGGVGRRADKNFRVFAVPLNESARLHQRRRFASAC